MGTGYTAAQIGARDLTAPVDDRLKRDSRSDQKLVAAINDWFGNIAGIR